MNLHETQNQAITRRAFLRTSVLGAGVIPLVGRADVPSRPGPSAPPAMRGTCALDDNRVRFHSPALRQAFSITVVADTHLFRDDERGAPYRTFSARMARDRQAKHFKTGAVISHEQGFTGALAAARKAKTDVFAMLGDIVNFPSEAAVEWVRAELANAGLPSLYVAGNHDWHYEGMEGTMDSLRAKWIEKRLLPLYQGRNPMMATYDVKGVRLVVIDNSTNEIQPEQLAFFQAQAAAGLPLVLMMHIPLYAPGRPIGFGCGHPEWGAASDRTFEVARRPRWPEAGHTAVTREFHRTVFTCPSLLGIFAGHIHRASTDVVNGIPQFVADANFKAAFLTVDFVPERA